MFIINAKTNKKSKNKNENEIDIFVRFQALKKFTLKRYGKYVLLVFK